jgi:carbon-monoxide dehydrogenase medium subunit
VLRPFELHRPPTVAAAADLLTRLAGDVALYAGGTEILLLLKEGLVRVRHLVDVKAIPGLDAIGASGDEITIGATVTHRGVERSPVVADRCPILARAARHVANVRVRNVGTVAGNLAFADPHSDVATLLVALDAVVCLGSRSGTREVPVAGFLRAPYETAREPDEIVTAVRVRPWPAPNAWAYVKFGVHERPTLGVAVALGLDAAGSVVDARVAVGCVGPRPARVPEAEERLRGRPLADLSAVVDEVGAAAARHAEPVTDLHGSADYKRDMVSVFVRRAVRIAAARGRGQPTEEAYRHAVVV